MCLSFRPQTIYLNATSRINFFVLKCSTRDDWKDGAYVSLEEMIEEEENNRWGPKSNCALYLHNNNIKRLGKKRGSTNYYDINDQTLNLFSWQLQNETVKLGHEYQKAAKCKFT